MFEVNRVNKSGFDCVEITDTDGQVYAIINLDLGGSLQELTICGTEVITGKNVGPYAKSYASSILFPFVNRIANGRYDFEQKTYQLHCNNVADGHALHGLVFDRTFGLDHISQNENSCTVSLFYAETENRMGFPFRYELQVKYTIKKRSVEVMVEVKNTDKYVFPFALGWHPYFASNNLNESYLKMECQRKIITNSHSIPEREETVVLDKNLKINQTEFDDCFVLDTNTLWFSTPDYKIKMTSSMGEMFVQLYTPQGRKAIAIEPQTGPANCFNMPNKHKVLRPNETFEIKWSVDVFLENT